MEMDLFQCEEKSCRTALKDTKLEAWVGLVPGKKNFKLVGGITNLTENKFISSWNKEF